MRWAWHCRWTNGQWHFLDYVACSAKSRVTFKSFDSALRAAKRHIHSETVIVIPVFRGKR